MMSYSDHFEKKNIKKYIFCVYGKSEWQIDLNKQDNKLYKKHATKNLKFHIQIEIYTNKIFFSPISL